MKNNKFILVTVGLFVAIIVLVAYYLLVYQPKQQEIILRKQTYELCVKKFDEISNSDAYLRLLAGEVVAGRMTKTEMNQELAKWVFALQARKDGFLAECVEKRLNEYKK